LVSLAGASYGHKPHLEFRIQIREVCTEKRSIFHRVAGIQIAHSILFSLIFNSIDFMTTRKRNAFAIILSALLALDMSVVIYVVHKLI
jgi:hypothetical protein